MGSVFPTCQIYGIILFCAGNIIFPELSGRFKDYSYLLTFNSAVLDIVIPLTSDTYNGYIELKFALRSIQKHLTAWERVFLIGGRPEWLSDHPQLIHIHTGEVFGDRFRDQNIFRKLMIAVLDERVSDDFLYFHDDHFLLQQVKAANFPLHHKGTLEDTLKSRTMRDPYKDVLMNTIKWLIGHNSSILDFDTHAPMVMNKVTFLDTVARPDWHTPNGYVIKSLYANMDGLKGSYYPDCKIRIPTAKAEVFATIKNRPYFSTSDRAMGADMMDVFLGLYPKPSKFEL
jgi:hypothetical protein